jgi:hypothetical protein
MRGGTRISPDIKTGDRRVIEYLFHPSCSR